MQAGESSLWLIPRESALWTMILNRAAHVFHRPHPGRSADALRFEMAADSASMDGEMQVPPLSLATRWQTRMQTIHGSPVSNFEATRPWRVFMQTLRPALRQLLRNPRSSALAIAIIGLAIGASVGIGTIVDRAVLRPLPYPEPDRLVVVWNTYPQWQDRETLSAFWDRINLAWPEYVALRERRDVFREIAIHWSSDAVFVGRDQADVVRTGLATHGLMRVLGTAPVMGRWFTESDDRPGASPVAVLSGDFWRSRLGADPEVLGRAITIDNELHTVIGVLPDTFQFRVADEAQSAQLWMPLGRVADPTNEGNHSFVGVARLQPGVSLQQALAAATTVLRGERSPDVRGARVIGREEYERGAARPVMLLFSAAVVLLLLLACATVAALQLTRIVERSHEIAVRSAIGASPGRIGGQLLAENLLLGLGGGVVGVLLAGATIGALVRLMPPGTPGAAGAGIDARVLALTLALSLGTAVIFGLAPVWRAVRADPVRGLHGDRATERSPGMLLLVGIQSALAVLLVVGAALLVRTVHALSAVDPGFATAHRLTFDVQLPDSRYTPDRAHGWMNELAARIQGLPGVLAVAGTSVIPLSGSGMSNSVWLQSYGPESGPKPEVQRRIVTPEYFSTLRIPLLRGRAFTSSDDESGVRVMIVSRAAADRLWRGRDPLGDLVELGRRWYTVVGVAADVRDHALHSEPVSTAYVAAAQWRPLGRRFVVQTALPPLQFASAVREMVRELDPAVPVRDLRTLDDVAAESTQAQRARAVLVAGYAIIATLLALAGLYGVTSYGVSRRSREFAIRSALGARTGSIVRLAMRQSVGASLTGMLAGLALALGLTRVLRGFLFAVEPADPLTLGGAAIGLAIVATLAAAVPAFRAARIDPIEPLRRA